MNKNNNHRRVLGVLQPKKRAQTTIFIIIALVIVVGVIGFFIFRALVGGGDVLPSTSDIFDSFENCIEEKTREAISIAGSQAGYIENPEFEAGSVYSPFSSQLDFLGTGVPYWYYISSNGVVKEQVPSKVIIENQIEEFLNVELENCDFSSFRSQGYEVNLGDVTSDVRILNREVRVEVNRDIGFSRGDSVSQRSNHEVSIASDFGEFYNLAREIYGKEKDEAFLEFYSQDTLYNYAPVTGSEISCSPLIWNAQEISNDLKKALSANVQAIKVDNGNYKLQNKKNEYFVVDISTNENVRFMYEESWPTRVEIWPADGSLLVAEPVGLEQGMGLLGFCYVPYHFVYDVYHPVLIQIYNDKELFQFPVSVVIDKSVPRDALNIREPVEFNSLDSFCDNANTEVRVNTFDSSLNPVEADISYSCFNEKCLIGSTKVSDSGAVLNGIFPQCVNGIVSARAEGYVQGELIISTNEPTNANVVLDKLYELPMSVSIGGLPLTISDGEGLAIINFVSDSYSTTVVYPNQLEVELAEGLYNISVQVFGGSSLTIPGGSRSECVSVPKKGLLGFFGGTTEECFNINIPETKLDRALVGGGESVELILEENLRFANGVKVDIPKLPSPLTVDQLQQNYELVKTQSVGVNLI
jgi:hypothetical protein